jgi:hypothetical protein
MDGAEGFIFMCCNLESGGISVLLLFYLNWYGQKPDDGHECPKHVVLIITLIFKNIHALYHTICVIDYPLTYLIYILKVPPNGSKFTLKLK